MPKFFVISDIHGYYKQMIEALESANFDENNEEHWLICCGDCFDRGPNSVGVMRYLNNLPRKILIRGNHELLFEEACNRGYFSTHDFSNGTVGTILQFDLDTMDVGEMCLRAELRTRFFREQMVNYFETKNYIFVHGWIPVYYTDDLPKYYTKNRKYMFNPNWREASLTDWEIAMWSNPFDFAENKEMLPDKTIVFGHWHCSTGWARKEGKGEFDVDIKFEPFYGEGYIGIDACTAFTRKCNVIVLEDEFMDSKKE